MVIINGTGLKPTAFSTYEKVDYQLSLPEDTARVFKPEQGMVVPFHSGDLVGTIIPVKTISNEIENGVVKHRFYGYYVVYKHGSVHEVLDAGIYERVFAENDSKIELGLPAKLVKRFKELDINELNTLAASTPVELLLPLHVSGQRELVSKVVADMLRRDPLRIVGLPEPILKNYVVNNDDPIIRTALLENTPAMIKVLETELKSRGFVEAEKLSLIYYRYWEEEFEDEVLEKASRRRAPVRSRELTTRLASLGATLPLTVAAITLPVLATREAKKKDESEEMVKAKA